MERKEAFDTIVALIKPFARDEAALSKVSEETKILQDLKVNSARLVDLVIAFEDKFGVTIDDSAAEKLRTVGDTVSVVLEKVNAKGA